MLRITKQSDYGIVLLTQIALATEGSIHNARDLAKSAQLPFPTVSKILKALARSSLLVSHRGVKGGYSLARAPEEISVREVIVALEGPIAITTCLDDTSEECDIEATCPVRANWQKINEAVRGALDSIPLSDMATPFTFPALSRSLASHGETEPADAGDGDGETGTVEIS